MIPRSKAEIMCMIRALYIDRISIVIWWKYWILLTPCPSFLALGSWMWRNELRPVCVTDCRLASLPAQQLSWCRHHSKLSAGAWIFAVLTPSNNNTNIFIVIMLDIFKVNAICWIHWHWALNLPGNLTSMNWLLSGLPDCHGLGLGQLGHPGAQRQQTSDFVSTNIPNFCQATSPNWRGGSQAMEHFHQTCQMSRKIVEPFLSVLVPRCQWFRIRNPKLIQARILWWLLCY